MTIDWVFVLVLIIVSGIWSEIRYKMGVSAGIDSMKDEAKVLFLKERLSATYAFILVLVKKGVLKVEKNALVGYDYNRFLIDETLSGYINTDTKDELYNEQNEHNL